MPKEKLVFLSTESIASNLLDETMTRIAGMGFSGVVCPHPAIEVVNSAHRAGLKAHAELTCFAGEQLWKDIPACRPVNEHGEPIEAEGWYHGANPANQELRARKLEELAHLTQTVEIDGLWLDFIRWPCHWEVLQPRLIQTSFDEPTVHHFQQETGLQLESGGVAGSILHQHFDAWVGWKASMITTFAAAAKEILTHHRPGVPMGLFGIPWTQDEYGGAIRTVIGQDFRSLARHVDIFSPMAYHAMCGRPVQWIMKSAAEIKANTGKAVIPVVQCMDVPRLLSDDEFEESLRSVLESGMDGIMLFEWNALKDRGNIDIVRTMLR